MLRQAIFAMVEKGLNQTLALDSTALSKIAQLSGSVIQIHCLEPAFNLFLIPNDNGLTLASDWQGESDCCLTAPLSLLMQLAYSKNKTQILHAEAVDLTGNTNSLMQLTEILQALELDWEYALSRWLGPVTTGLIAGHLRSRGQWIKQTAQSLEQAIAEYLTEESRDLVGKNEANIRFNQLDQLKIDLDRLEARLARLLSTDA